MLPGDDQLQRLIKVVGPLKFSVQLPDDPEQYFSAVGAVPSVSEDQRRYLRTQLRVVAALQYRRSLPALKRANQWYKIVMRDISRSGVSFLHSEQVFPTEQLMLVMPDCKPRCIEVMRCRRLNESCYEIGANFIQKFRSHSRNSDMCSTSVG
jgi:hypothetical protein